MICNGFVCRSLDAFLLDRATVAPFQCSRCAGMIALHNAACGGGVFHPVAEARLVSGAAGQGRQRWHRHVRPRVPDPVGTGKVISRNNNTSGPIKVKCTRTYSAMRQPDYRGAAGLGCVGRWKGRGGRSVCSLTRSRSGNNLYIEPRRSGIGYGHSSGTSLTGGERSSDGARSHPPWRQQTNARISTRRSFRL